MNDHEVEGRGEVSACDVQDMMTAGIRPQSTAAASLRASHWPPVPDVVRQSQTFFVVSVSSSLQSTASNNTGSGDEWLGDSSARKFSHLIAQRTGRSPARGRADHVSTKNSANNQQELGNCWDGGPWLKLTTATAAAATTATTTTATTATTTTTAATTTTTTTATTTTATTTTTTAAITITTTTATTIDFNLSVCNAMNVVRQLGGDRTFLS